MTTSRILIRGPNWIGDSVLGIPSMKAIRAHFVAAEITLLVRPWVAGLFTFAPFVDRIWSVARPSGLGGWLRLIRQIRNDRFDLALLFPNSFESALMVFLGRIPTRIGYATDYRSWLLTNTIQSAPGTQHQVEYYLGLARAVSASVAHPSIRIEAAPEEREKARRLLRAEGIFDDAPFLVLNPGAAYGSAKRWKEDGFARVGDILSREMGLRAVIVGSKEERHIGEAVRTQMISKAAVLSGKTTLETLIGVLAESSLVITNDSGCMHIAAALGVPTVAVFGPTDDRVTGPFDSRACVVKHPVECSPCLLRECPIDHRCMERINVMDVCQAARKLVGSAHRNA